MTTKQKFLKHVGKGKMFACELRDEEREYLQSLVLDSLHHNSIAMALDTLNEWRSDKYFMEVVKDVTGEALKPTIFEALEQITEVIMTEKICDIVGGLRENYSSIY